MSDQNYPEKGKTPEGAEKQAPPAAPAAPAAPPVKTRRVGTFTMAIGLIVLGVLLVLRAVRPTMNFVFVLQLLPGILILLGIEILISNLKYKNEKLKYDGLSIFVCLLLIVGGIGGAAAAEYLRWDTARAELTEEFQREMQTQSNEVLQKNKIEVESMEWALTLSYPGVYQKELDKEALGRYGNIYLTVWMGKEYKNEKEFEQEAGRVAELLTPLSPGLSHIHINSCGEYDVKERMEDGTPSYQVSVWEPGQNKIAPRDVETTYWLNDWGYFVEKDIYEAHLQELEQQKLEEVEEAEEEEWPEPEQATDAEAEESGESAPGNRPPDAA